MSFKEEEIWHNINICQSLETNLVGPGSSISSLGGINLLKGKKFKVTSNIGRSLETNLVAILGVLVVDVVGPGMAGLGVGGVSGGPILLKGKVWV